MPAGRHGATASILGISAAVVCMALHADLSAQITPLAAYERAFETFNRTTPPAYRAHRRLEGGLVGSDKHGWMEVWTQFTPPRDFTFDVVREGGSEYIRNRVLRNMLENEQELLAAGKGLRAGLEARNYHFEEGGLTESGNRRVLLKAARKSIGVVNGSLVIDPERASVLRLSGRLVKSPSFWVRDVDVTWTFATIRGYVVPVEMTSAGRVRIFGRSNFKMTYEYESIDGQRIDGVALRAATGAQEN